MANRLRAMRAAAARFCSLIIVSCRIATSAICWQQRLHDSRPSSRGSPPLLLLLAPRAGRLRPEPAAEQAAAAAADRDGGQAGRAQRHRPGRICRPLRRGRTRSRCAPASPAISTRSISSDGQLVKQGDLLFTIDKRPFQNTLDQARANLAQAQGQSRLHRGRSRARASSSCATAPSPSRSSSSARRPSATRRPRSRPTRRRCGRPSSICEFTELRAPVAGRIGDRRVSPGNLVTGGAAGTTTLLATIVSLDPIRFEFTFDEASYLRYERFSGSGKEVTGPRRRRHRRAQADRREGLRPPRLHGFRRQRHRPLVRHDPRPRRVRQSRRRVHARHVRAHPRAGLAGLRGAAGAGCRDRHRAGPQIRAGGRRRQHRGAEIRHARAGDRRQPARHQGRARAPTTASSSTA